MQTKVAISTFMFFHLALPAAAVAVNQKDVLRNLVTTSRRMTNCFSLDWNLCCLANTTVHSQDELLKEWAKMQVMFSLAAC